MKRTTLGLLFVFSVAALAGCSVASLSASSSASKQESSSSQAPSSASSSSIAPSSVSSEATSENSSSSATSSSLVPAKKTVEKTIKAYRLFNFENEYLDPDLSEEKYQLGSISFRFIEGEELVPYVSLENMAGLYSQFFKDKNTTKSQYNVAEGKSTWTVTVADKEVFRSAIDAKEKTFTYQGRLDEVMAAKKDYSGLSLTMRTKLENTQIALPSAHTALVSYADTEFETFEENGITYFPFSMLHTLYHDLVGRDFFYNYTYLYEFNNVEDISTANVTEGENVYTPLQQMMEYISEHYKEADASGKPLMPMYARKHHRSELALIFNHYYGIRETWRVRSMMEYFSAFGIYDDLISDNSAIRGAAYAKVFFMLGDNHTARTILGDNPWAESNGNSVVPIASQDPKVEERIILSGSLTAQRDAFLKANGFADGIADAVVYSKDGKTAYFGFDSFDGNLHAKNPDGTPMSDEILAKSDSYFYFAKQLKAIKEHVTDVSGTPVKVSRVIIDDSLNSGGYIYAMGKILALLSKDNKGVITTLDGLTHNIAKQTYRVDTNADGAYDEKDVYGNDFKFYILTSPVSFSCGNAFPFIAKQSDHIHIIGQKSGGGECVVTSNYLSNGMGFAHSSNEHLVILNEQKLTYEGVEDGVRADAPLRYCEYYDMDAMSKAIDSIRY